MPLEARIGIRVPGAGVIGDSDLMWTTDPLNVGPRLGQQMLLTTERLFNWLFQAVLGVGDGSGFPTGCVRLSHLPLASGDPDVDL